MREIEAVRHLVKEITTTFDFVSTSSQVSDTTKVLLLGLKAKMETLEGYVESITDEYGLIINECDSLAQEVEEELVVTELQLNEADDLIEVYARQMEVIQTACEIFQLSDTLYRWLSEGHAVWDDVSPMEMCNTEEGFREVMEYLGKVQANALTR